MNDDTKGDIGLYLCRKCGLLQNLYVADIERSIADEYCYLDSFTCKYCGNVNEYRFPRENNGLFF